VAANKKHHYVPRFYLRAFAQDGRSLSLYNLKRDQAIQGANLKNQCYRDYMYGKDGKSESNLSQLEGSLSTLLKMVLRSELLPRPLSDDHLSLCVLTLLQSARTAYMSDAMDEMSDKTIKQVLSKDSRFKDHLNKVRIHFTDPANYAIHTILRLYHLIIDLDYRLLVASEGTEFITSDNPVVLYNQLMSFEDYGSKTGLASKGLQIFFPFSPKLMLAFFDRDVYAYSPRQAIVATVPSRADMLELNALQVASALENVYYTGKAADIFRVVRRAKPHRRQRKAKVIVGREQQTENGSTQIIGTAREDVRTDLSLTFVKLIKPAKAWRGERMKPGPKPAVVLRNPALVRDHELFEAAVEKGTYQPTEFLRFVRDLHDA
jgi:hypothetical protein